MTATAVKAKFPKEFWTANFSELLERAAFYGVFITLTMYLTDVVGFTDPEAGWVSGIFSAGVYFLPIFSGAYADKIGYKKSLIIAFSMLSIGYFMLSFAPTKVPVTIAMLFFLMVGGSFIKSVITGTVARGSNEKNRARAFSIFYSMVNIGSFSGKMVAKEIRTEYGLEYMGYYSAALTAVALVIIFLIFKEYKNSENAKSFDEIMAGLKKVLSNGRLMGLILIVSGFWLIQHQMYASMPKFIVRMVGEDAKPEWYANVNPAMVMIFVMLVTKWVKDKKAITSITLGMFIMPFSTFFMASGPWLQASTGESVSWFLNMHPFAVMMVFGIAFQGFAECFISPRYLEYFSLQSPKGDEGMFLGFAHLHSFFANLVGFVVSGYLLDAFCPDPERADLKGLSPEQLAPYYEHAHYIWYVFAAIGLVSAIALVIYQRKYKKIDELKAAA